MLFSWQLMGKYIAEADNQEALPLGIDISYDGSAMIADFEYDGVLPGKITVKLNVAACFTNAAIVSIAAGSLNTCAVVDEGYIEFVIDEGGTYSIISSGRAVGNSLSDGARTSDADSSGNEYTANAYKGSGNGTELEPLTILGDLSREFQASWKSMNTTAGYEGGSYPSEAGYDGNKVKKEMIEYRSTSTGHLYCSIYIDGSKWQLTTENDKGPYYLDYRLNPDSDTVRACLESHSLYTGSYAVRLEPALEALNTYSQSSETQLFYISRTREFAGPITYRLDVSDYYGPGDIIDVEYALGCANGSLYHGTMPSNASLLLLEPSYSKYDSQAVVDYEGYVSFTIYNGGFFTLTKSGQEKPLTNIDAEYTAQEDQDDASVTGDAGGDEGEEITADQNDGDVEVTSEADIFEEEVQPETESETAVLQEAQPEEEDYDINFSMTTPDGAITVEGSVSETGLALEGENLSEQIEDYNDLFENVGELKELYAIDLIKPDGAVYELSGDDYLKVTIILQEAYTVSDMDELTLKHINKQRRSFQRIVCVRQRIE